MTDRELLEMAAKAAGLKIDKSEFNGGGRGNTGFDFMGNAVLDWHNGKTWNPLADDGDALRLAVKLSISMEPGHICKTGSDIPGTRINVASLDTGEAMRRSIVMCAAEVGKKMQDR